MFMLDQVDPEQQYSIRLKSTQCYVGTKKHQLIWRYGGEKLEHFLKNAKPSPRLLKRLMTGAQGILEFLVKLSDHQLVYQDIKPSNIVIKGDRLYLMDFRLAMKFEDTYTVRNAFVLNYTLPFFPPEFKLFSSRKYEKFKEHFCKGLKYTYKLYGIVRTRLHHLLDLHMNVEEEMQTVFNTYDSFTDPAKIDTYSFGLILYLIYVWSRADYPEMLDMIKKMISFDVKTRYTPQEALAHFKTLTFDDQSTLDPVDQISLSKESYTAALPLSSNENL